MLHKIKKIIKEELKSNGNIVIRKITKDDLKQIIPRLGEVFNKTGLSSQQIWDMMRHSDFNKSVVATIDDNIAGFYFFSNEQIPETENQIYYKLKNLNGIEGVALGIFQEYKNLGIGKKLIEYPKSISSVDYIWGYQLKTLKNIDDWLKRRKIYAENNYLYITYELFNKSLSENFKKRLNEIKALDAYNQYYKGLVDKENQEKDLSIYNTIVRLDPTFIENNGDNTSELGKYAQWFFRKKENLTWILNNIKTHRGEDLYKIKEDLIIYEKLKKLNQLPLEAKDINKLNIETLADLTYQFQNQNLQSNTEKEKQIKQGAKKVFENNEWLIVVPETEESACYYGKGTKWCTAATKADNQFNNYHRQGTLYILINKTNPSEKYQFHFESGEFKDVMNRDKDLGGFFWDNDDIHEFFSNKISNLGFILCETALKKGDTEQFDSFYERSFTDEQKRMLITAAFDGDSDSSGYYTVSHALNYLYYEGMEKDFRRDFLDAFESSLQNKYDDENYDAKMFLDYLGGINKDNYDDIFRQVNFEDADEIEKIIEIVEDYDNGYDFLNRYIQEEDIELNYDLLDTLEILKNKFYYSKTNKLYSSKLAQVKIHKIVDFQKGLLNISFIPKDSEGNPILTKKVTGNINYKNLIKYLTIPQIPLNESRKNKRK
jgi:hypothetical protein